MPHMLELQSPEKVHESMEKNYMLQYFLMCCADTYCNHKPRLLEQLIIKMDAIS